MPIFSQTRIILASRLYSRLSGLEKTQCLPVTFSHEALSHSGLAVNRTLDKRHNPQGMLSLEESHESLGLWVISHKVNGVHDGRRERAGESSLCPSGRPSSPCNYLLLEM